MFVPLMFVTLEPNYSNHAAFQVLINYLDMYNKQYNKSQVVIDHSFFK